MIIHAPLLSVASPSDSLPPWAHRGLEQAASLPPPSQQCMHTSLIAPLLCKATSKKVESSCNRPVWLLVTGRSTPQRLPTLHEARLGFHLRDMRVCERKPGAALDLTADENAYIALPDNTPAPATEAIESCVGPEDNRTKVQLLPLRATLIERSRHASGQVSSDHAVHLVDVLDEHRCGEQSIPLLPLLYSSSLSLVLLFQCPLNRPSSVVLPRVVRASITQVLPNTRLHVHADACFLCLQLLSLLG
jgi:hypothetical protein